MSTTTREIQLYLKFRGKVALVAVRLDETAVAMADHVQIKAHREGEKVDALAKRLSDAMEYAMGGSVEYTREHNG